MKSKISVLLLLILFTGCEKKIELIDLNDDLFYTLDEVNEKAVLITEKESDPIEQFFSFAKKLNIDSATHKKNIHPDQTKRMGFEVYSFNYRFFIDDNGKILRVLPLNGMGRKMDNQLLSVLEEWEFKPAVKDDKEVKSQLYVTLFYADEQENFEKVKSMHLALTGSKKIKTDAEVSSASMPAEPDYFVAVEEMPEPIGGLMAIQQKIIYPEIAKRAGIEGRVMVLTFIDEKGNVEKTSVLRSIGAGLDEAAVKAIMETKFKPGKQRGKPVKVQVVIPIQFKLN